MEGGALEEKYPFKVQKSGQLKRLSAKHYFFG